MTIDIEHRGIHILNESDVRELIDKYLTLQAKIMKLTINGIEIEIEGAESVEVLDGGKRLVVHGQNVRFVPYPIISSVWPPIQPIQDTITWGPTSIITTPGGTGLNVGYISPDAKFTTSEGSADQMGYVGQVIS